MASGIARGRVRTTAAVESRNMAAVLHITGNLVPRSLVDEADGEIWQSKKICFSSLAAPFDSCPIPSLKIDAVFRGNLSSNSSSNLEISAVGENQKPIGKDRKRKDLEVICHSKLNNFCNMIVPLPKSQTRHPLLLPHMLF